MKIFTFVLFAFIAFLMLPTKTFADYISQSDSITGTMHITPKNPPIAGQPVTIAVHFSDKNEQFYLQKCICTLTISEPGRLPYTQIINQSSSITLQGSTMTLPYVFPMADSYTIAFSAQPSDQRSFTPFSLHWKVSAFKNDQFQLSIKSSPEKRPYLFGGIVLSCILFAIAGVRYQTTHKRKK